MNFSFKSALLAISMAIFMFIAMASVMLGVMGVFTLFGVGGTVICVLFIPAVYRDDRKRAAQVAKERRMNERKGTMQ